MKKLSFIFFTVAISAISLLVAQLILGSDPAAGIAHFLHLGHGAVVAALLAGLLSFWLVLGTAKRLADFGGWQLGVLAGVLFWQWGQQHVWRIETIIRAAFGDDAVVFTSLVTVGLLFAMMRYVALWGSGAIEWIIEQHHKRTVRQKLKDQIAKLDKAEVEA